MHQVESVAQTNKKEFEFELPAALFKWKRLKCQIVLISNIFGSIIGSIIFCLKPVQTMCSYVGSKIV